MKGFRSLASMGRLVLFDKYNTELFLCTDVQLIDKLVGKTATRDENVEALLYPRDVLLLKEGRISREGLFKLWGGVDREEKEVLLDPRLDFGILMELRGEDRTLSTIAVPSRFQKDPMFKVDFAA